MFSVNGREDLASLLGFTEREYSPSKIKKEKNEMQKEKEKRAKAISKK